MPHRLHSPASLKEVQAFRILSIAPLKEIETLHIDIFGPLDCPLIAQAWSNFSHQLTSLQVNLTIQDFSDQLVLTGTCTTLLSLSLTLTLAQAPIEVTAQIVHNFYQLCPHTLQTLRLRWDRPTANFTRFFEARKFPELRRLTVRGPEFLNTLSSPHPHVTALSNYLIHPPQTLKHVALGRAYSEAKIDISLLQQLKFSASTSNLHLMGQLRFHSRWLTQLELHVLYSEPAGDDLSDKVAPALSQAASLERLKITSYTFSVRGVASVANYIPGLKLFWWHTSRFERTGMYYVPGTILPFALDIELRGSTFRKWKLVHLWVNVLGQSISRDLHAMLAPFCRNMTGYGANVEEEGGVLNELLGQWDFKDSFWLDH
ncbi:hypothetical protein DL96DRAFT_1623333 [Flagelloscypha sp. PMI_526]|nr:hypothetical protein DL96DRAFT_1623333 [Flagelloscypha sp. PMI_526]